MVGWEDDRMTLQYFLHNGKLPGGQPVPPSAVQALTITVDICCIMDWTGQASQAARQQISHPARFAGADN